MMQMHHLCFLVGVTGLEPAASCSQSRRATSCATPRYTILFLLCFFAGCLRHPRLRRLVAVPEIVRSHKLSQFRPLLQQALTSSSTGCVRPCCPKQARYQLRYTPFLFVATDNLHYNINSGKMQVLF